MSEPTKCRDCWQDRRKWERKKKKGREYFACRVCGRFIGYIRHEEEKGATK